MVRINQNEADTNDPQPCDLNLSVLDALVVDVLKAKPAKARSLQRVRRWLEEGEVESAVTILQELCPDILQDGRYMFKLTKQSFTEKCRKGEDEAAITCARKNLAPLALDAYPEAYLEFKNALQLLVYDTSQHRLDQEQQQHVTDSKAARQDLATTVYHAAWKSLGLQEPTLLPLLTYLLHLHHVFRVSLPDRKLQEQGLVDHLLPPMAPRDSPPLPPHAAAQALPTLAPGSCEAHVQNLIQCTGTSRRDATDALKHAHGDQQLAFRAELFRLRLNHGVLDNLLQEYVAFRGLEVDLDGVSGGLAEGPEDMGSAAHMEGPASFSDKAGSLLRVEEAWGRTSWLHDDSAAEEAMESGRAMVVDSQPAIKASLGAARVSEEEGASTSGSKSNEEAQEPWSVRRHLQALQPFRSRSQSPPNKVLRGQETEGGKGGAASFSHSQYQQLHEKMVQLSKLGKEGHVEDMENMVCDMDSTFFEEHPELLFSLRRCRFLQLLNSGDAALGMQQALLFARSKLSPLASSTPSLQPVLKATMALLLTAADEHAAEAATLQAVASNLQTELRLQSGIRGPALVKLLQVLLGVHRAWLKQERFVDPFQSALKLDVLRQGGGSQHRGQPHTVQTTAVNGRGQPPPMLFSLSALPDQDTSESEQGGFAADEDDVLRIMEVLELPRSAAIELLQLHSGEVEAAITSSFG